MKYILYITVFVAGMAHAAAQDPLIGDNNDFIQEIIPHEVEQIPIYGIPPSARSAYRALTHEAAVQKLKLHAPELATKEELAALEELAQQQNYGATPEQLAKSTQIRWINPENAYANVEAIDDLTREKRQKPVGGKKPREAIRRRLF